MSETPDSTFTDLEQRIADLERLLAESEAQKAAMAEVLGVINSSPGDLTPVFDAILEKALRLCEADAGVFHDHSLAQRRWVAVRGVSISEWEAASRGVQPTPGGAYETMMAGAPLVHIPDLRDSDAYRSGDPARKVLVDKLSARAALWVALRKNTTLLGHLMIYRREPRAFGRTDRLDPELRGPGGDRD